jgi:hypothetical protein
MLGCHSAIRQNGDDNKTDDHGNDIAAIVPARPG